MTPKEHAKLLGLFMWIFAGLQLAIVGAIAVFYTAIFGVVMAAIKDAPHSKGDPPPEAIFGIFAIVMIILVGSFVAFSIPKLVAGYGLRKGRSWAKIWTIIACVLLVINPPLGTAVGIYGLWFIFGDAGTAYFDGPDFASRHAPQAPPPNNWQ